MSTIRRRGSDDARHVILWAPIALHDAGRDDGGDGERPEDGEGEHVRHAARDEGAELRAVRGRVATLVDNDLQDGDRGARERCRCASAGARHEDAVDALPSSQQTIGRLDVKWCDETRAANAKCRTTVQDIHARVWVHAVKMLPVVRAVPP